MLSQVHAALSGYFSVRYLVKHTVPGTSYPVMTFGGRFTNPFASPDDILYVLAGARALLRTHRTVRPTLLLAQDGLHTGLFTALVGQLTGTPVWIMDHGTAVLATNREFQEIKLEARSSAVGTGLFEFLHRRTEHWRRRVHMASLSTVLRLTESFRPSYLLVGDEVADVYRRELHVDEDRIRRYAYTVDTDRFRPLKHEEKRRVRASLGVGDDVLLVTLVNRLAPEKGLDIAIAALAAAREALGPLAIAIGGTGPLHSQVEQLVRAYQLDDVTMLLGDLGEGEVARLLGTTDIFLYAGRFGTNQSVAILEAMSSGCAVIATPRPASNTSILADGRGRVVPVDDTVAMAHAIVELADSETRLTMTRLARDYIERYHTIHVLRSALTAAFGTSTDG